MSRSASTSLKLSARSSRPPRAEQHKAASGSPLRWLPAQARGDASLVHRLVSNLVDNALRYNEPGGHVEVEVSAREGRTELRVANSGEVVPLGELERLLQPFQRMAVERGTGGEGLGSGCRSWPPSPRHIKQCLR